MQTVKNKPKNIRNKYLKFICKDKNFILSLKQPKNVHKELAPSSFISILKTLENQELIYKMQRIEKMQNIYQIYLNEINKVIEFGDFAKKLTATRPMSHII